MRNSDNSSNDAVTFGACFSNVCLNSCSFPLSVDGQKSDSSVNAEPNGNSNWGVSIKQVGFR